MYSISANRLSTADTSGGVAMVTPLVTIIVPVYNLESYVAHGLKPFSTNLLPLTDYCDR